MDDLTRLFDGCQCGSQDCTPDPDPNTDHDLPGELTFGSPAWHAQQYPTPWDLADDGLADCLSEYDILEGDRPNWEDIEEYYAVTRDEPSAADLALAVAEIRGREGELNGYSDSEYTTWAADFDRSQWLSELDQEQPDDRPEYDEDIAIRGHRAGTDLF